jgi:DNA repair and recombination protein RAD54 and RAD54-like protein
MAYNAVRMHTGVFDDGRPGRGGLAAGWESLSGKFAVMAKMLDILWNRTTDKIVIVSNYTQTLDLITTLCRSYDYPFVRLDGTTTINKRQKLVRCHALACPCLHALLIMREGALLFSK